MQVRTTFPVNHNASENIHIIVVDFSGTINVESIHAHISFEYLIVIGPIRVRPYCKTTTCGIIYGEFIIPMASFSELFANNVSDSAACDVVLLVCFVAANTMLRFAA